MNLAQLPQDDLARPVTNAADLASKMAAKRAGRLSTEVLSLGHVASAQCECLRVGYIRTLCRGEKPEDALAWMRESHAEHLQEVNHKPERNQNLWETEET